MCSIAIHVNAHYIYIYATGFWKTNQIVTLGLFHFISPANGCTQTLFIHSAITWSAFLEPVLPTL